MKHRRRIYYSAEKRAEIWDRWKRGESAHEIGRLFDRGHSSIFKILMKTGGMRPTCSLGMARQNISAQIMALNLQPLRYGNGLKK